MVKSGRDKECTELGKDLTDLGNTGNVTGDQILLSMEQRTPWGDPRAVSQYLQEGYWKKNQPACSNAWLENEITGTSRNKRGSDSI